MSEFKTIRVDVTEAVTVRCTVDVQVPAAWDDAAIDAWLAGEVIEGEPIELLDVEEQFCDKTREQMDDFREEVEGRSFEVAS